MVFLFLWPRRLKSARTFITSLLVCAHLRSRQTKSPATQASNPEIIRPSLALTIRCLIGGLLVNTEPIVCIVPGDVFTPVFGQEESIKRPLSSLDLGYLFQLIEVACSDVA